MYGYLKKDPVTVVLLDPVLPGSIAWKTGKRYVARWVDIETGDEIVEEVHGCEIYSLMDPMKVVTGVI